ncbi:MAG: hypothetical protein PHV32_09990 [Eubacteriales bacterium]|nr:hypothetical protein [Eubacteriales bacterium]
MIRMPVKNYAIFYTVDEQKKLVEITRVIYAKRDLENQRFRRFTFCGNLYFGSRSIGRKKNLRYFP